MLEVSNAVAVHIEQPQRAPSFLLLTGTAPASPGVGGVILRDLVQIAGPQNCRCLWLASKYDRQVPYLSDVETVVHTRRFETGYRPVRGIVGEMICGAAMRLLRPAMLQQSCNTAEYLIHQHRPDFLLAVLDSPASVQLAYEIHRRTGIPLRTIVWDDVEVVCRERQLDRWTRRWIRESFSRTLRASERIAVICENMRDAYRSEHGVDSFILRHGVARSESDPGRRRQAPGDCDIIGFAGSITAPDCLNSLVKALDQIGWHLNGRNIGLRLLGCRYTFDSRQPQRIEYFGWRPVAEARDLLAECSCLYLPQTFSMDSRRFSELSFPTKLSTYVAAQRPILLHAPAYSSLSGFWQDCELGPHCKELSVNHILDSVRAALTPPAETFASWMSEICRTYTQVLSPEGFETSVRNLIS